MNKSSQLRLLGLTIILISTVSLLGQTPEPAKNRRLQVWEQMKPGSVMILRSKGTFGKFHHEVQDGNFYYLTGIDEPNAILVLKKTQSDGSLSSTIKNNNSEAGKTILFLTPRDESRADWDALPLGLEGAREQGFPDVRTATAFSEYLDQLLLSKIDILYMDIQSSQKATDPFTADEQILLRAREKGAGFSLESPGQILTSMGMVRDSSEIKLLRKAIDITAQAQIAVMQAIQPGLLEYQVQAVAEYVFTLNGARRDAFPCIVGSGENSCILHWMLNTKQMKEGEVVVVDMGALVDFYPADITRTYPVSGKFTARQRQVYEIVLEANQAAIAMVAPGVDFADISLKASEVISEGLVKLGLIQDKKEYRKYFFHGLGHSIGLHVGNNHSLGLLKPGMVLTIEPGIYIQKEQLGIRIEDDVLVTETGHEVLSKGVPKSIDQIEKLMKLKGIDTSSYRELQQSKY